MEQANENPDDWAHFFHGFDDGDSDEVVGATQAKPAHTVHTFPLASAANQRHRPTSDGPAIHRASTLQEDRSHDPSLQHFDPDTESLDLTGTAAVEPRGRVMDFAGEPVFVPDSPDIDDSPLVPAPQHIVSTPAAGSRLFSSPPVFTEEDCLKQVLILFPDVCHYHVHKLFYACDEDGDYEQLPPAARLESIIEQLATSSAYPKQRKGKLAEKKRKRDESEDEDFTKPFEDPRRESVTQAVSAMRAMLKVEFPEIPQSYIAKELQRHRHLYQTYVSLATAMDTNDADNLPYRRGRPSRLQANDASDVARDSHRPELIEELRAARIRVQALRVERAAVQTKKEAEQKNLEEAIAAGEMAECQACFEDLPMNRQIHCDGEVAHFTCFECAETYIKTEVGDARCRVLCTAGCGAGFKPSQLNQLSDKALLEKLAQLQQEKDIRDAGLDNLEECPFCDYKAIVPPIEEDFEFRCDNPSCALISCRRCKSVSHIPLSCEVHAKENKLNNRHKVEEAMTSAMIRHCNKCKKPFFKEDGCNKMTCPSCGNLQCYVCSKSIVNYNHFNEGNPKAGGNASKCPLHDDVNARHEREVKEAEVAARAEVIAQNPEVSEEDLEIKVSEAVIKDAYHPINYHPINRLRAMARHDHALAPWWQQDGFDHLGNLFPPVLYAGNNNNNNDNNNNNNNVENNNNNDNNNVVAPVALWAGYDNIAVPPAPLPRIPLAHPRFPIGFANHHQPGLVHRRFAQGVPGYFAGNVPVQNPPVNLMGHPFWNQAVPDRPHFVPRVIQAVQRPPEMPHGLPPGLQRPAYPGHEMPQVPRHLAQPENMNDHDNVTRH